MNNVKISVLISVYGKDNPLFFKEALESVSVRQTYKPLQIVIVEDGPVSSEIENAIFSVKEAACDIDFKIIRKEVNAGLAAALNSGLAECKCEWVARMDSDDISVPERFQIQSDYINRHKKVEVIGGYIDEFKEYVGDIHSTRKVGSSITEIMRMAKVRTPMNHVSVMYKKSLIDDIGGYSEDFGKLEDYKLWVDLLSKGAILANVKEVLVHVRIGNGFLDRRSNSREIQDWDMLQNYLLAGNIISIFQSFKNKLYIRLFIYTPTWIKKFLYSFILRQ